MFTEVGKKAELVAPAGNLASLKAAAESGADSVYVGFRDQTKARNFEGLNFSDQDIEEGLRYLHQRGKGLYLAINTFPQKEDFPRWQKAVDRAVSFGVDAIILADLGVLSYARTRYPQQEIHLSVQASSSNHESINFYKKHFNIKRVILPRVVTLDEIRYIHQNTDVELEVFAIGGLCINIEGRCFLSSFVTGASTNTEGACSPSRFVEFSTDEGGNLSIRLNGVLLNRLSQGEASPYPTCCKGRYLMPDGTISYPMEEPSSLNVVELLPGLLEAGVCAFKIEGRQRTRAYIKEVTRIISEAIREYEANPNSYRVKEEWLNRAIRTFEGTTQTLACYMEK